MDCVTDSDFQKGFLRKCSDFLDRIVFMFNAVQPEVLSIMANQ